MKPDCERLHPPHRREGYHQSDRDELRITRVYQVLSRQIE